ncbi:MAG: leucine-rich repeat domain-containing protein [Paludibacteraceae bacterium]|nr:leucine-rich repeat domain-containing protein [Paludibacteraceae bacterium]
MRKFKLLAVLAATMFATTNLWATPADIGTGTGLQWEVTGTTLTITYDGVGTGVMPDYQNKPGKYAPWYDPSWAQTLEELYPTRCSSITAVSLPDGLKRIGNFAFYYFNNPSLTEITIPSSVTEIGNSAFAACWALTTVNMRPASVPTIGTKIFNGVETLERINVPDAVAQEYANALWIYPYVYAATSGNYMSYRFEGDFGESGSNLHWVVTGNDLTITGSGSTGGLTIGNQPWKTYMNNLETIHLPVGITNMGSDDFFNHNVEKVYLPANPAGLTWDEDGDDFKEEKATICYVPDEYKAAYIAKFPAVNVTFKGESEEGSPEPVADPNGLSWTLEGGVLTFTYDGVGTGIMEDYTIATEGSNPRPWHDSRASITSVVLPEGLTYIGDWAFYGFRNSNLTSITIPSTVTSIGQGAFADCTGLTSVTIPANVTSIGIQAFEGCTGLTSVIIPANVTEIGAYAFDRCSNLASVTCLPTTAPTVGNEAFDACHANLVITYPNGSDQDYANKFLQSWDHLRNASSSTQPGLPHLHATFGDANLEWDLSFTGSTGTLLEHDGTLAISGTGEMDDYNWKVGEWAPWHDYENYIHHVNIASGVTKIGISAFADMKHVNTFIIPASVTYIGGDAFFGCNNTEMIVYSYANPENLEWHDNSYGFEGYPYVPDDFLSLTRGPWGNSVFVSQATKCVVPSNYLEGYKAKWARGGEYRWYDLNVWFASELQDGESASYITTALTTLNGKTAPVVTLVRPLNRDGYFATLCLPFNMSAAQIAESSLHGAEIKEFVEAEVDGDVINVVFSPVTEIEAGKPYFVKYTNPELLGEALDRLDFMEVTINNVTPQTIEHNGVQMIGTFVPKAVEAQSSMNDGEGILFLGASNTLFYPNAAGNIKPFRAYFHLTGGKAGAPRKGMPARIVERQNAPTGVDNATNNAQYTKRVENGQLVIERNGVRYNAAGQVVK